ncbi:MAG: Rab family GTPase [Promethearchaeota archaeon]
MTAYKLKILLCGPAAVGKTSLIYNYIHQKFQSSYKLTVGVDILTKTVEYAPGESAVLSIWDIGGQQRFEFIRSTFYKGAAGVLLVFDLTRPETWDKILSWRQEVRQYAGDIPFVLIGNKVDLLDEEFGTAIDRNAARQYAESQGSIYIETSAKTGQNVEAAFEELTRRVVASKRGG